MKTREQIERETKSNVFTKEEFLSSVHRGEITSYDGIGYFHDGENETLVNVYDETLSRDKVKHYPYICWYNK